MNEGVNDGDKLPVVVAQTEANELLPHTVTDADIDTDTECVTQTLANVLLAVPHDDADKD